MTYRAWNLKPLDRAALRELTQAIAEQAAEELEYNAQNDEPWSEQKYAAALAAQQKEKHDRGKNETAPEGKPAEKNVRLTRSFLTISVFRDPHTPLSHTQSPLSPTAV